MKLAIFADEERRGRLEPILTPGVPPHSEHEFYESYDSFIRQLPDSRCDAVVIAHRGAAGMQSARAARILLCHVPIVWFSDDSGFVEESYRVGCAYFSAETITETLFNSALLHCGVKGEN